MNNGFGCGCDINVKRMNGLGVGNIDHDGFVTLGDASTAPTSGTTVYQDLAIGLAAFASPIVYNKFAPRKWPHAKKMWQDIATVVVVYFAGSYAVRKYVAVQTI